MIYFIKLTRKIITRIRIINVLPRITQLSYLHQQNYHQINNQSTILS
jgi:hypothetical protein